MSADQSARFKLGNRKIGARQQCLIGICIVNDVFEIVLRILI